MPALILPWDEQPGTPNNIIRVMDNDKALRDRINGFYNQYRTLISIAAGISPGAVIGTSAFTIDGNIVPSGTGVAIGPWTIPLDPADFSPTGATTVYRLRATLLTNTTAPTSTFTVGLYPIASVAGGGNLTAVTLGTVVAGSTVAQVAPASSSQFSLVGADFTAPAAGNYVIGLAISVANTAALSLVNLGLHLEARNV